MGANDFRCPGVSPYTLGNATPVLEFLSQRTVYDEGKFALPYLSRGLATLDCGCGPGSFTRDFVRLGSVPCVGIDIDQVSLNFARSRCTTAGGRAQPSFVAANLESLPFKDNFFDFAFCHTVLMQLGSPASGMRELSRVLKPHGLLAIREPVLSQNIYPHPNNPIETFFRVFAAMRELDGGNANIGLKVPGLVKDAGFRMLAIRYTLRWLVGRRQESTYELFARMADSSGFLDRAVEYNLISKVARAQLSNEIAGSAKSCGALYAAAFVEVMAENR